jgi:hypothetical protein
LEGYTGERSVRAWTLALDATCSRTSTEQAPSPLVGEKITPGERWHDADNLKKGRPMLAYDLNFLSALLCNVQTNSKIRLSYGNMKNHNNQSLKNKNMWNFLPKNTVYSGNNLLIPRNCSK